MITKMKKLTFLIYYKEYEAFLKRMQELGVLHVQTAQEGVWNLRQNWKPNSGGRSM